MDNNNNNNFVFFFLNFETDQIIFITLISITGSLRALCVFFFFYFFRFFLIFINKLIKNVFLFCDFIFIWVYSTWFRCFRNTQLLCRFFFVYFLLEDVQKFQL